MTNSISRKVRNGSPGWPRNRENGELGYQFFQTRKGNLENLMKTPGKHGEFGQWRESELFLGSTGGGSHLPIKIYYFLRAKYTEKKIVNTGSGKKTGHFTLSCMSPWSLLCEKIYSQFNEFYLYLTK